MASKRAGAKLKRIRNITLKVRHGNPHSAEKAKPLDNHDCPHRICIKFWEKS